MTCWLRDDLHHSLPCTYKAWLPVLRTKGGVNPCLGMHSSSYTWLHSESTGALVKNLASLTLPLEILTHIQGAAENFQLALQVILM